MITKNDLLKYAIQNPSKYAHKFGHVDVNALPDEGYIDHLITKAKTNLDGTPSKTVQELMAEANTPAVLSKPVSEPAGLAGLVKEAQLPSTDPATALSVVSDSALPTPDVDGGNTLEDNEKKTNG